jgi:hypothetical protein
MPLIKCSECGHDVSTSASACPNCGAPNKLAASGTAGSSTEPRPVPPPPVTIPRPAEPARRGGGKKWWFMGCGCLALIGVIAVALFTGAVGGLSFLAAIMPKVHLQNVQQRADTQVINGDFDWGVEISYDLQNTSSDPQDVTVEMRVSCSEGKWTQRRSTHLQGSETQHVTQFFAQPTINATNINSEAQIVTDSK